MQTGQVFTLDAAGVDELASFYKRDRTDFTKLEGEVFSIAKSGVTEPVTPTEVRASMWKDGKPSRGRPRKFPRSTVARLLGETDDDSLTNPVAHAPEVAAKAAKTPVAATVEDVSDEDLATDAEALLAAVVSVDADESTDESEDDGW